MHHESQFSASIPERRINEMWRSRHRYWRKHHGLAGAGSPPLRPASSTPSGRARADVQRNGHTSGRMWLHARDAVRVTGPG